MRCASWQPLFSAMRMCSTLTIRKWRTSAWPHRRIRLWGVVVDVALLVEAGEGEAAEVAEEVHLRHGVRHQHRHKLREAWEMDLRLLSLSHDCLIAVNHLQLRHPAARRLRIEEAAGHSTEIAVELPPEGKPQLAAMAYPSNTHPCHQSVAPSQCLSPFVCASSGVVAHAVLRQ